MTPGSPRFDLVLLGIGPDGHCASLFPDQASLSERSRLVVGVEEAGFEPFVPRVSMTLPALTRARQVVFLATGESKAGPVAAAFGPAAKPDPHVPRRCCRRWRGRSRCCWIRPPPSGLGSAASGAV